jgi:hypothetical protein
MNEDLKKVLKMTAVLGGLVLFVANKQAIDSIVNTVFETVFALIFDYFGQILFFIVVVIPLVLFALMLLGKLIQFFDDVHRIANNKDKP